MRLTESMDPPLMRLLRNRKFIPSSERHASLDYRSPSLLRNVQRTMTFLMIVFLAAIAYVIFWFLMVALLKSGLKGWTASMRNDGYLVQYGAPDLSGFPFHIRLDLGNLKISATEKSDHPSWSSKKAVIAARPWRPDIVTVTLKGPHILTYQINNGSREIYHGDAFIGATLNFDIGSYGPVTAEIKIKDLSFDATGKPYHAAVDQADIALTRSSDKRADYKTHVLDIRFTGKGLTIPENLFLPLGNQIKDLRFNGAVLGPVKSGSWPDRLAAWRDLGGTLDVTELAAVYGPMTINASGTMALDKNIQPIGAFTAKIEGFFKTVDMLRQRGLIRSTTAITAKLVLGVMAQTPKDGGPPSLNLAIAIQNQKLFAGPVTLAKIPRINWRGKNRAKTVIRSIK